MSESQCPSLNCMILYGSYFREFWRWLICHQQPATSHLPLCSSTTGTSSAQNTQQLHVDSTRHPKRTEMFKRHREHVECVKTPQPTVLTDFRVDPHASTFTELCWPACFCCKVSAPRHCVAQCGTQLGSK